MKLRERKEFLKMSRAMAQLQGANINVNGVFEREEWTETMFEEIMAVKFPNLIKTMNSQI